MLVAQKATNGRWCGQSRGAKEVVVRRRAVSASFATVAVLLTGSLSAHHSPSAVFDMAKPFVIQGTLTKVDWVNPHISLFIDARGADGLPEAWKIESQPPSWFKHVGLVRADIAKVIGQTITVGGVRARDGSHYAYLQKLTFPDGNSIELDRAASAETKP
jgi:hypothetical protein